MAGWNHVFLISVISVTITHGCYDIGQCFESQGFKDLLQKYQNEGRVNFDGDQLNKICRDWQPMQNCIERNLESCYDEAVNAAYKVVYNMFDYLCNDGREAYMKHVTCFAKPSVTTELQSCQADLKRGEAAMKNKVKWGTLTKSELKKEFCRLKDRYLNCIAESIQNECGHEAETTFRTFMERSLKPMLDLFECNKSNKAIIIGCVVAGVALLLLIIVIVAVRRYRTKRATSTGGSKKETQYGHV